MGEITTIGRKNLTTQRTSSKNGVAVLGEIMAKHIAPLQRSHHFRILWQTAGDTIGTVCLGEGEIGSPPHYLGKAKEIHAGWLRHYAKVKATNTALSRILMSRERVDTATALRMVSVLFAALGKKKSDEENALLMAATVDMLSPLEACVGIATGLWELINQHPFILAVAIKRLIATAKFTSAAELREEMKTATGKVGYARWVTEYIGGMIERADEIVFLGDRAAWEANHASVSGKVALAMRDSLFEDGGDDEFPPSPRWQALNALHAAKRIEFDEAAETRRAG